MATLPHPAAGAPVIDLPTVMCPDPVRRAVMVQRWNDVVFLHWRYDPAVVQRLLPDGVTVDAFDGSAWVGLVPFRMDGLGVPGFAPLPMVGSFPEVNVRTYVRAGRRRGVWFFSLDVDRRLPAIVARTAYHLPYFAGAAMHRRVADVIDTRVERCWPAGAERVGTSISVRTGDRLVDPDPLRRFLTARWGLITSSRLTASRLDRRRPGGIRYAPVDHPEWALHAAELTALDDGLVAAAGLPRPHGAPHVMWSPGVDVRVGRPVRA